MLVCKLPGSGLPLPGAASPSLGDHVLFTERLAAPYACPEYRTGPGILWMLAGSGHAALNGKKESLDPCSFLLVNGGSRLSIRVRGTDAQPGFLLFHPKLVAHTDLSYLERVHPLTPLLKEQLDWLVRLGDSCSSFSVLKADILVRQILEELVRQHRSAVRLSANLQVARRSTRVELFKRLSLTREWIEENSASPITLKDMSAIALLNRQHFLRMFQRCYQVTPHQHLIDVRLAAARKMLSGSGESILSVCQQAGFESLSSFSGLFRRRFGLTPSAFRQAASTAILFLPSIHGNKHPGFL